MNTTKSIDETGSVNPNSTEACTETLTGGGKPAGYVKMAAMTTAAQYLASCGGVKAKGLKLRAQLLWWHLVMLGGPIRRLEDERAGVEVYGKTSRVAALADRIGASVSTVRKALDELKDAGLIQRERTVRGFRTWVLLPDAALKAMPAPSISVSMTHSDDAPHASSGDVLVEEPPHASSGDGSPEGRIHASLGERFHASLGGRSISQTKSQTKNQIHHHQKTDASGATETPPPDAGGGGGGELVMDQGEAGQVRTLLRNAGVFVGKLDELTTKVASMPDGLARLRTTYERIRNTTRSPAAVLVSAIRAGELDELSGRELASRREQQELADAEQRFSETLPEFCERMSLECGPYLTVPLAALVDRVVHGRRDAETDKALSDLKAMTQPQRRRWLLNHEQASKRRLAGMDYESTTQLGGDADEDGVDDTFRASDAMRQVLQTAGN